MKTTSNKKTINSSAYLLFFALLLASQSGYAQTEVGGGATGTNNDRYIINADETATDAALRFQSKESNIFNDWMIYNENSDGDLHISNWRSSSHSNSNENDIGEKYFTFKNGSAPGDGTAGELGINVAPMSGLDINHGNARTGSHAINRPMYITGPIGPSYNGIEFRHYNATQGIGFGYNTIYATGSNSSQELNFQSRGTGNISLKTGGSSDLFINGSSGNVGIGTTSPSQRLDVNGHAMIRSNLYMDDGDVRDIHGLYLKDWDDNTGGNDSKYRLLARDGAWMYYDGGVVIGAYGNGTWSDVPTGRLVVQNDMVIGDATPIAGTALTVDGRVYISDDVTSAEEGFGSGYTTNDNYKDYLLWVEEGVVSPDYAISETSDWPDYVFDESYELYSLEEVESHIAEKGHLHTMPSAEEVEANGYSLDDLSKRMVKTIEELTLHAIDQEKRIQAQNVIIEELMAQFEAFSSK
ncbi:MAG: hypothetical protein ACJA08_003234 [Cyclobacteriaceae bacterium]|jgi:hypothetical protein